MWKDTIKKFSKKNYHPVYGKSKFWGAMNTTPNEFRSYVEHIVGMNDEQRSDVEVQKDIKYIKEHCKKKIAQYQKYLDQLKDD